MYVINTDRGVKLILDLKKVVWCSVNNEDNDIILDISFDNDSEVELMYYSKEAALKELDLLNDYLTRIGK